MTIRKIILATFLPTLLVFVVRAEIRPTSWPWVDSMDAVRAAPKNHKVLYEDDRVRILEVSVYPGEKEPMHFHRWPSVLILDRPVKSRNHTWDGKTKDIAGPTPRTPIPLVVRMGPEQPHSMENLATNILHLYRIEFKKLKFCN